MMQVSRIGVSIGIINASLGIERKVKNLILHNHKYAFLIPRQKLNTTFFLLLLRPKLNEYDCLKLMENSHMTVIAKNWLLVLRNVQLYCSVASRFAIFVT